LAVAQRYITVRRATGSHPAVVSGHPAAQETNEARSPRKAYVRLGGRIAASASYAADPLPSLARLRCSPLVNWWMYGKGSAAALARCAQLLCRVLIKIGSLHRPRAAGPTPVMGVVDWRGHQALVAQRIEHLTTDRFAVPAVLTRDNASNVRPVCTESEAQIC